MTPPRQAWLATNRDLQEFARREAYDLREFRERDYDDDLTFWRWVGIAGLHVPEWAIRLRHAYRTTGRKMGNVPADVYATTLLYLARHHPDAAVAIYVAAGIEGLVAFAAETRAA